MSRIAGIMTGTSVDAIDIAICDIERKGDHDVVSLHSFQSFPFSEFTRETIRLALGGEARMEDLCDLPYVLARDFAAALEVCRQTLSVDAVAVHGQTLWHHPPVSTWQAMSGPALAALTNLPVIHDFRSADVACGGQGAPLVPVFDHATLTRPDRTVVALNIGGMANITILPPACEVQHVRAFDTGPGNVWIDAAARLTFGKEYDHNGAFARSGRVLAPFLAECATLPFFAADPPKSTGREVFSQAEIERLVRKYAHPSAPLEDVLTTVTELTAWSVADHIARYAPDAHEIVASGGGVHNTYLCERLTALLAERGVTASLTVHPHAQAKEAMAFAYLGWLTLQGRPGNLPSVTGASRAVVLGSVARA